jgi:uncharacterized protein (TIRG00374 family)
MTVAGGTRSITSALRRRLFSVQTLLSLAIAAGFIVLLASQADLDWGRTWANVRGIDLRLYIVGLALYYLSFAFRGLRWRILAKNAVINSTPGSELPSTFKFSQLIVIGWFVNSIGWLRVGDAYRAYGLSNIAGGKFSSSLGTVLAERVTDMVTVLGLLAVAVVWYSATRESGGVYYIALIALAMAAALAGLMVAMKGYGHRIARLLPGRFEEAYGRFQQGALGSLQQLPAVFALGVAGWLLEAGRLYFVVKALSLEIDLPLVLIVALGGAILSTVPTPGGIGAVEPGLTSLLVLGLERSDAASVVLIDRSITYVSVLIIGGLVFLLWQLSLARRPKRDLDEATGKPESDPEA